MKNAIFWSIYFLFDSVIDIFLVNFIFCWKSSIIQLGNLENDYEAEQNISIYISV